MKDNKGFTLIELIGVLIIMAMLILVVFPATMRLITDNEEKKYNQYYDIILKGADVYAKNVRDDLGGNKGEGCVDDIKLSTLVKENYVKAFDEEGITCGSPSDFVTLDGYDLTKYIDIKISNKNGRISTDASLICVKGRKIVYSKLVEKTTCNKYVAEAENILIDSVSSISSVADSTGTYYVNGNVNNNYVWYSGKLWRIVSYNKTDKTIKLVTDQPISILSYDMSSSSYVGSNINVWLNNEFLTTLRGAENYLLDANWNYTTVTNSNLPADTNIINSKVGLLNYYEYSKGKAYLDINQEWWLLSSASSTNSWYVNSANTAANASVATFKGVRPSIVLRSNVAYIPGGIGTRDNPYKLVGDNSANVGAFLNTRYEGEYVRINNVDYRISGVTREYTRLVAVNNISGVKQYHYYESNYSAGTTLGSYLNTTWVSELSSDDSARLYDGDFCIMKLKPDVSQTTSCPPIDIINVKVGIPKIGDMFTTANSSGEYWTLSPTDNRTLNVVTTSGSVITKDIELESGVRPVISIVNTAKITGGNGTAAVPYTIG